MSTSGIMIMIVLILCLELIQRPEISASVSPPRIDSPPVEDTISQLQQEIHRLERRIVDASSLIQSASQMTASEMDEQIQNLQTVNRLLSAKRDDLRAMLKQLEDRQTERNAQRALLAGMLQRFETAQREVANMAHELEIETQDNRPVFSLPRGENRSGWIVDVSASRIQVAPIGRPEKPISFVSSRGSLFQSKSPQKAFLEWAKRWGTKVYFFVFVRPDGVDGFQEISEAFEQANVSYGFDLADSEQMLLHPVRGAAE